MVFYTTFFFSLIFITFPVNSIHFQFSRFNPNDPNLFYQGSAAPLDRLVNFNINELYSCQIGRVLYSEKVLIWDSKTGQLTDFTTHYTFIINTQNHTSYGHGLAFFMVPFGFEFPLNSDGGFMGLFNTTTMDSPGNQMVHVEFDSYPNGEWGEKSEHVGINKNSIISSASVTWNASIHSGDSADVWISYNSTTKNLTVTWKYQATPDPQENTSLSLPIDLSKILPEWATVGFSAATSFVGEINYLLSWEFNSTLEKSGDSNIKETRLVVVIVTVSCVVLVLGALAIHALVWRKRKRSKKQKEESMHLTSMNNDLERGAGPRRFTYKELYLATNNFSKDRKLGQGGFGAVFKGYFADLDLQVAVKKISRGSKQGKKEYVTEVKVISQLRHRNLVKLLGWCHDKGRASKESDVYSFGIVVLEITTGKKAIEVIKDIDGEKGMIDWVWDHYGKGELLVTMDENLKRDFDEKQIVCLMVVGLWCAHPDVNLRPLIRQAIQVLNFEVSMPNLPPKRPVANYHAPTPRVNSLLDV
ncbi:hypothetical protein TSUD_154460 [Trifolium subterraneum]|uniref:Protein kinase domain-containing protein n=1 Tax=Trifolium subterraneum TaxID=3900 RepID=A0A2Z6P8S4_TRISU|nr:hypothetical protein TSUD_154460 [Trifolium subterraneum]